MQNPHVHVLQPFMGSTSTLQLIKEGEESKMKVY